jgi:hypothetical protein
VKCERKFFCIDHQGTHIPRTPFLREPGAARHRDAGDTAKGREDCFN